MLTSEEMKAYKKIPVINEFRDADGNDIVSIRRSTY